MAASFLIIDSSVIVKWFLRENERYLEQADSILADCREGNVQLFAPELAKYEVGNVIRYKGLSKTEAETGVEALHTIPIAFVAETNPIARDTMKIAYEADMTYYDASFPALAKHLSATLVTDNIKHQGKSTDIRIIPLKEYAIRVEDAS